MPKSKNHIKLIQILLIIASAFSPLVGASFPHKTKPDFKTFSDGKGKSGVSRNIREKKSSPQWTTMRSQRARRCWLCMQKQSQATARQKGKYGSTDDAKATNDKKQREIVWESICLLLRRWIYSVGMFVCFNGSDGYFDPDGIWVVAFIGLLSCFYVFVYLFWLSHATLMFYAWPNDNSYLQN